MEFNEEGGIESMVWGMFLSAYGVERMHDFMILRDVCIYMRSKKAWGGPNASSSFIAYLVADRYFNQRL